MIEISQIANNLYWDEKDEIWKSKKTNAISYPADGNINCLKIEDESFWFKHRNNILLAAIKNFAPGGTFFDIGGGNGYVSLMLSKAGIPTVLVEPGIEGTRNARLRGVKTIICSTIEEVGFLDNTLPAVGIFDVLEHIEDDSNFLKKIHQILVKNGRLFITVPAFNLLWSVEDDYAGHYRRYSKKELLQKVRQVGFKVEYTTYLFSFLPLPILFFRTIPSKLGLKKKFSLAQFQKENNLQLGIFNSFKKFLLAKELSLIKNRRELLFGSSILLVAQKA